LNSGGFFLVEAIFVVRRLAGFAGRGAMDMLRAWPTSGEIHQFTTPSHSADLVSVRSRMSFS